MRVTVTRKNKMTIRNVELNNSLCCVYEVFIFFISTFGEDNGSEL
jgi:hypothetical protein